MKPVFILLREMDGEETLMPTYYIRMYKIRQFFQTGLKFPDPMNRQSTVELRSDVLDVFEERWSHGLL